MNPTESILNRLDLTIEEFTEIVDQNPSLRGPIIGYSAEYKLHKMFEADDRISCCHKDDDHDRKKKGDARIVYKGHEFIVESKSLQTNKVQKLLDGSYEGGVQCDASDRRPVTFPDGSTVQTTNLLVGEFDILAANLFAFGNKWKFSFALNRNLEKSRYRKYTEYQQQHLLATMVKVSWPVRKPFVTDIFELLDVLVEERGGPKS